jgi:hypothetical protein
MNLIAICLSGAGHFFDNVFLGLATGLVIC